MHGGAHVEVVVRMRVVAVPCAVVADVREEPVGSVEQRQAVGKLEVQVMAALWQHGPVVSPVDVAGAGQRGVLVHVAVPLRRLVHVVGRVVLYGGGDGTVGMRLDETRHGADVGGGGVNSLRMWFCWRFLHRHMAIKASRISTITTSTQPTIGYRRPPGGLGSSGRWGPGGVMVCWLDEPGDCRAATHTRQTELLSRCCWSHKTQCVIMSIIKITVVAETRPDLGTRHPCYLWSHRS